MGTTEEGENSTDEGSTEAVTAALAATMQHLESDDFCQKENCNSPVDMWCDRCNTALCYRCSIEESCFDSKSHRCQRFGAVYSDVNQRFKTWRDGLGEELVVLDYREQLMKNDIEEREGRLKRAQSLTTEQSVKRAQILTTEQSEEMRKVAEIMTELATLQEQIIGLKQTAREYGADLEGLSKPEYLCKIILIPGLVEICNEAKQPLEQEANTNGTLQFIAVYEIGWSISVHHHSRTGEILVGCEKGVKIIDNKKRKVTDLARFPFAVLSEHKGEVFIASERVGTVNVYKFDMDSKQEKRLFSYRSAHLPIMSASNVYIACAGDSHNEVKLYNRLFKAVGTIELPSLTKVSCLQFLPNSDLLVAGCDEEKHKLNCYRLNESGEPSLSWSHEDAGYTRAVAVDVRGNIFLCGPDNTISMVSSEGGVMQKKSSDDLKERCWDISVRGDELVVAGLDKGCFLYNIQDLRRGSSGIEDPLRSSPSRIRNSLITCFCCQKQPL